MECHHIIIITAIPTTDTRWSPSCFTVDCTQNKVSETHCSIKVYSWHLNLHIYAILLFQIMPGTTTYAQGTFIFSQEPISLQADLAVHSLSTGQEPALFIHFMFLFWIIFIYCISVFILLKYLLLFHLSYLIPLILCESWLFSSYFI